MKKWLSEKKEKIKSFWNEHTESCLEVLAGILTLSGGLVMIKSAKMDSKNIEQAKKVKSMPEQYEVTLKKDSDFTII